MQSGLDEMWWSDAMVCFCYLKNVVDLLKDNRTAYKRRFEVDFHGPRIPFGAEVSYKPITEKDKARLHEFGSSMLSGIFLGYGQKPGGAWNEELIVLDWEQIQNAQHHSDIYPKRFHYKEVDVPKPGGFFRFLSLKVC